MRPPHILPNVGCQCVLHTALEAEDLRGVSQPVKDGMRLVALSPADNLWAAGSRPTFTSLLLVRWGSLSEPQASV